MSTNMRARGSPSCTPPRPRWRRSMLTSPGTRPSWSSRTAWTSGSRGGLAAGRVREAERRLMTALLDVWRTVGAEAALVTCSALPPDAPASLRRAAPVPVVKIDEAMARAAVRAGGRIGVVASFPATLSPTRALLAAAAAETGVSLEAGGGALDELVPGALEALLAGQDERHDDLIVGAVRRLVARGADVVVLAQVSMARALDRIASAPGVTVPVLLSLPGSLGELRAALARGGAARAGGAP